MAGIIQATAAGQGVECKVLVSDAEVATAGAQLARHARVRDLVLMTVYGPLQYPRLGLVEAVLFRHGQTAPARSDARSVGEGSDGSGCLGCFARGESCLV